MDERLTTAEERIAHLTRAVDELSDVVTAQASAVDRLDRLVRLLIEREAQRDEAAALASPPADQRPPHW